MLTTIHGHFYQPPRENPWTGEVPRQVSAAPFHDWNDRITMECYLPNGRSRVLDPQGRITAIVNNYARLSFDFGPTLLSDLERRFPDVYLRVLEADRESALQHGGHGGAMAQAYNHMILPLANYRDKRTQIRWGLRDFEHRFRRRSEGLWLPETAVDAETLHAVGEAGVRFIILAPHQARSVRKLGEKKWREVAETGLETGRAYRCFTDKEGTPDRSWVDVFFYDGSIAVAVSFEHLLRQAGTFSDRLEEAGRKLDPGRLVHFATDGEVYGHHEPFADMCLAYFATQEAPRRGIRLMTYPEVLDLQPPEFEVRLNYTDTGEGTAWSCTHGVGRWSRDCGCSTGGHTGWNQRWRAPLRRGLDAVRDQIQAAFLARTSAHLKDAWAARDDYIDVLLRPDPDTREAFLRKHMIEPADETTQRMIWTLCEANHQAMLMYTSCAWFFDDISGLEVQQNLGYAARACELAQPYVFEPLEPLLLRYLKEARSNVPEWKNGAVVYRESVLPRRVGPEHAAAEGIFGAAVLGRPLDGQVRRYRLQGWLDPDGDGEEAERTGRIRVTDPQIAQSWSWSFDISHGSLGQRRIRLVPAVDPEASVPVQSFAFRLRDLQEDVREEIAQAALRRTLVQESGRLEEIYEEARGPMGLLLDLGLESPEIHRNLGAYVLGRRLSEMAGELGDGLEPIPDVWWERVEDALAESRRMKVKADETPLAERLAARVNALLDSALAGAEPRESLRFVHASYLTLARADRLQLPLPRTGLEPRTYDLVLRFRGELRGAPAETLVGAEVSTPLEALARLAGHANLSLEAILKTEPPQTKGNLPMMVSTGGTSRHAQS